MEQLYKNIKARRVELGLTQQELAEKMGYTNRSSIAKIENGAVDLSQSKIIQFAKVLETTPGALMGSADHHEELINTQSEHQEYYEDETVRAVTDRKKAHTGKIAFYFRVQAFYFRVHFCGNQNLNFVDTYA